MDYYDVAFDACRIDGGMERSLGFKRIFAVNRDLRLTDVDDPKAKGSVEGVIIGANKRKLLAFARGGVRAAIVSDSRIDKKLMEQMADSGIVLCMPMSAITASAGLERTKTIYMMSSLFAHARKSGIHVSFVTLAGSSLYLASSAQLIELATLVGADEQYARYSISEINRQLVE